MNTLQDFLDQQPALAPPAPERAAAIALRMKSAFLKATSGDVNTDLAPIKVEADKLADPEKDALRTAFNQFIDFHQVTVTDGVVPTVPPPLPPE